MRYWMKSKTQKPYMKSIDNSVVEVNNELVKLTGFESDELVGRTLEQVSVALRTFDQVNLENVQGVFEVYIFTKNLEPMKTTIKVTENEGARTFYIQKHSSSLINEKFGFAEQFYTDKRTKISLVAYPNFILLKANENYFTDEEYPHIDKLRDYNIGRNQAFVTMKDQIDNCDDFYHALACENKTFHVEECEYEDDKGLTYWNVSIVPIAVEGKAELFVQARLDVTEDVLARRQIEEQAAIIKQQKEELESVIENISEALIIYDKAGKPKKINKAARQMIACKQDSKDLEECFKRLKFCDMKGEAVAVDDSPINRVIRGEKIADIRMQTQVCGENKVMEVYGTPIHDDNGEFITGILCCRDITERMKIHEMNYIKNQYEILYKLIENLDMTVIRISYPTLRIKDMNQKVLNRIKKLKPWINSIEDVRMKEIKEVLLEGFSDEMYDDIRHLVESGNYSYVSNKRRVIDNVERYSKLIYQPVHGLNNEIVEIAVIGVDVTQEVEARNQFEHNMKLQEELFANISHELKTPLNVIFSIAQLLEFYLANQMIADNMDKLANGIHTMKQNCYRLTRLISNIVDMSKLEAGFMKLNLTNENIVNVAEDIVQSVAGYIQDLGMSIIFDTDVEEKIIACDPDKIERILLNLISNAIKFSEEGNEILVTVEDRGNTIEISVSDNGIGIDPCKLNEIFDRYHQVDKSFVRNASGSGIGLSLVKSIVELHGGSISVESGVGEGSIFRIVLPALTINDGINSNPNQVESNLRKIGMINIEFSDIYDIH